MEWYGYDWALWSKNTFFRWPLKDTYFWCWFWTVQAHLCRYSFRTVYTTGLLTVTLLHLKHTVFTRIYFIFRKPNQQKYNKLCCHCLLFPHAILVIMIVLLSPITQWSRINTSEIQMEQIIRWFKALYLFSYFYSLSKLENFIQAVNMIVLA